LKVLASYNIKGGVGKTTSAVNLAYCSANEGQRTLLIDLDPQAAATFYFRMDSPHKLGTRLFLESDWDRFTLASDFKNLNVLPADFSFRKMEHVLEKMKGQETEITSRFRSLEDHYDVVIFDCPPNFTRLTLQVFMLSDQIVCPVIPTTLSLRTLAQMTRSLKKRTWLSATIAPYFSMAEKRKTMHRQVVHLIRNGRIKGLPPFLKTLIPFMADIEKMGLYRNPLPHFLPKSRAAQAYENLWTEIKSI